MRVRSCSLIAAAILVMACSEAVEDAGPNPSSAGASNGGTGGSAVSGAAGTGAGGAASGGVASGGASGASGSAAGSGGSSAGSAGAAGAAGGGSGGLPPIDCKPWPAATATEQVGATINVSGTFDGNLKRFVGTGDLGTGGQAEDQPAFFRLANGAVLKNVILGAPAADGIHCSGNCTLQNVWWEDVGEDAATLDGEDSTQTMTIDCAGAKQAADKIFQHNGPGTMLIRNVVADGFGKLYRSCGNCLAQYTRHAKLENITLMNGAIVAGVNENYDDTVEFKNITVTGRITICQRYEANDTGAEPRQLGSGADGTYCLYASSDIHRQ